MLDLGVVRPGSTIRIPLNTFAAAGQSITATNLTTADILIYKDGGTTERASTSGYTVTVDFDARTGRHMLQIDLSDNTTAGFYSAGSEYLVVVDSITVDSLTVGAFVARFRIGQRAAIYDTTIATLSSQTSFTLTAGPAEDDALNGMWCLIHDVASAVQMSWALVSDYTGSTRTVTLAAAPAFTVAATDNISIMFPAPLQPTVAGRTLDVSTGGEAGLDWANIGSPTTAQALTQTTISISQAVASVVGNVGGNVTGSVGSVGAGGITSTSFAADSITSAALAASAVTEFQSGLSTLSQADIRTAVGLGSANLDVQLAAIDDYIDTEISAIRAVTDKLDTALELDVSVYRFTVNALENAPSGGGGGTDWTADEKTALRTILGVPASGTTPEAPSAGALKVIDDFLDTEVSAIKAKTDNLPAAPAATGDIPTAAQNAAALLDLPDGVEAGITFRQSLRLALAALVGKLAGAGGTTITIRSANDSKTRITATVDADGNRSAVTLDAT